MGAMREEYLFGDGDAIIVAPKRTPNLLRRHTVVWRTMAGFRLPEDPFNVTYAGTIMTAEIPHCSVCARLLSP